jgi:hypothetical protein
VNVDWKWLVIGLALGFLVFRYLPVLRARKASKAAA